MIPEHRIVEALLEGVALLRLPVWQPVVRTPANIARMVWMAYGLPAASYPFEGDPTGAHVSQGNVCCTASTYLAAVVVLCAHAGPPDGFGFPAFAEELLALATALRLSGSAGEVRWHVDDGTGTYCLERAACPWDDADTEGE